MSFTNEFLRYAYTCVQRILKRPRAADVEFWGPIPLWNEDKSFQNMVKVIEKYTLVDTVRCFMLYQYIKQALRLNGDVAEVGVFKGGSAKFIANLLAPSEKTLHLFDTFSGLPKSCHPEIDTHYGERQAFTDTSLEIVTAFMRDCKNVRFYKGLFPLTAAPIEQTVFSLVHIDADIYDSVKESCIFFYPRMVRGGIMIFDDYGWVCCPGAKKAVDEFFSNKQEVPCYLPTGQCIVTRL